MWTTMTASGTLLIAGTNAAENDHITFELSKPSDLWFHAKGVPGAHVLLRGGNITQHDMQEAANAAASRSAARKTDKYIQVEYCMAIDVSKPKRAAKGSVTIANAQEMRGYISKAQG